MSKFFQQSFCATLLACTMLLSGCMSIGVDGETLEKKPTKTSKILLTVLPAANAAEYAKWKKVEGPSIGAGVFLAVVRLQFPTGGYDEIDKARLNELVPHLKTRLPYIFTFNGIQTEIDSNVNDLNDLMAIPPDLTTKTPRLVLTPVSGTYSFLRGNTATIYADLINPATKTAIWKGEMVFEKTSFGTFDEKLANRVVEKFLNQMDRDQVVKLKFEDIEMPK